jgi:hypothetical protein
LASAFGCDTWQKLGKKVHFLARTCVSLRSREKVLIESESPVEALIYLISQEKTPVRAGFEPAVPFRGTTL